MRLTASRNTTVTSAIMALSWDVTGINIRIEDGTVSYYFEAKDSDGKSVKKFPVTVPIADVDLGNLVEQGITLAQAKGDLPSGTVT